MSIIPEDRAAIERRGIEIEYATLRSEILKRIEMRQQIVTIALTLAGIFLGVGLNTESVSLIYPPLATFLALGWSQNDNRIRDVAKYIRENLEGSMLGLGYETYVQQKRGQRGGLGSWRFVVLSHSGIFLVTQFMAIAIELLKFTFNPLEWALLATDLIAVLVVIWLMRQSSKR